MERLFLDANVLFSAAYLSRSGMKQLWSLARSGKLELVTSIYAVAEARRNLETATQVSRLEKLLRQVEVRSMPAAAMEPEGLPELSGLPGLLEMPELKELPEKDRPILLAAIAAKATHLITGDFTHFGTYYGKTVGGVLIVTPAGYLQK